MSERLFVATRKGLFTIVRRGISDWRIERTEFLGDPVTIIHRDPRDGMLLAALNHGHFGVKLHRSTDDGGSWEEIACPEYPPLPEGEKDVDGWGNEMPWTLKQIWALQASGADQPGVLWCGTLPGALFRSNDHGATWDIVRSLWDHPGRKKWSGGGADYPGINCVCVDPRDSQQVRIGVSCGGVWVTQDGGETWVCRAEGMHADYMPPERKFEQEVQDVHMLVQCRAAPDCYWVQHHNGIFRSTDNCASWQEIESAGPSTFGFAVAVHPDEPDTAWFVPGISDQHRIPVDGRVVVTRTRDGGKSFDVLTDCLPQEHAYDLVYRHALAIDSGGNRLAIGSTTGSVWVSEDQGDHWHGISQHLPPVYAVEFSN
jgi:hypothetical protein